MSFLLLRLSLIAILAIVDLITDNTMNKDLFFWLSVYALAVMVFTGIRRYLRQTRIFYTLILIPEALLILKIFITNSSLETGLILAYFFIISTAALNLGVHGGVLTALALTIFDLYFNRSNDSVQFLYGPTELRIGSMWLLAFSLGFMSRRASDTQQQIEDLNEELDSKMTVFISASRILATITDIDMLVQYFQETTNRIFGITRHALIMLPNDDTTQSTVSAFGMNEAQLADIALKLKVTSIKPGAELKGIDIVIGLIAQSTQGRYLLLLPTAELEMIYADLDLVNTIFSQFVMAFDSAILLEKARQASLTDHLTGLYNQRHFYERLHEEFNRAERTQKPVSVLIIDIDDFKQYNDTYGHLNGDKALSRVASVMKKACRDSDICARYGGEEFAVILPDTDSKGAAEVADRISAKVRGGSTKITVSANDKPITVSIGIACYPEHSSGIVDVVELADKAMYAAKEHGKDKNVIARKKRKSVTKNVASQNRGA